MTFKISEYHAEHFGLWRDAIGLQLHAMSFYEENGRQCVELFGPLRPETVPILSKWIICSQQHLPGQLRLVANDKSLEPSPEELRYVLVVDRVEE